MHKVIHGSPKILGGVHGTCLPPPVLSLYGPQASDIKEEREESSKGNDPIRCLRRSPADRGNSGRIVANEV